MICLQLRTALYSSSCMCTRCNLLAAACIEAAAACETIAGPQLLWQCTNLLINTKTCSLHEVLLHQQPCLCSRHSTAAVALCQGQGHRVHRHHQHCGQCHCVNSLNLLTAGFALCQRQGSPAYRHHQHCGQCHCINSLHLLTAGFALC